MAIDFFRGARRPGRFIEILLCLALTARNLQSVQRREGHNTWGDEVRLLPAAGPQPWLPEPHAVLTPLLTPLSQQLSHNGQFSRDQGRRGSILPRRVPTFTSVVTSIAPLRTALSRWHSTIRITRLISHIPHLLPSIAKQFTHLAQRVCRITQLFPNHPQTFARGNTYQLRDVSRDVTKLLADTIASLARFSMALVGVTHPLAEETFLHFALTGVLALLLAVATHVLAEETLPTADFTTRAVGAPEFTSVTLLPAAESAAGELGAGVIPQLACVPVGDAADDSDGVNPWPGHTSPLTARDPVSDPSSPMRPLVYK
ncbi:uncharacterized protein LOC119521154 [Choloepus didactylus]|uniref:uncharacterized protein LOC119521154 n=1 Tax=Choloepus didactylus TaxID=27675 RepID=UPI00189DAAA1|nr:uncharacterized protein LOC119521154 [Choloepus didactylus]